MIAHDTSILIGYQREGKDRKIRGKACFGGQNLSFAI
jgi:hypothetical protein